MNRQRRESESFEDYRASQRQEQQATDNRLRGTYLSIGGRAIDNPVPVSRFDDSNFYRK